jgi:hypothetical protein
LFTPDLVIAVLAALPVQVSVAVAAAIARRYGMWASWLLLFFLLCVATLLGPLWLTGWSGDILQMFGPPLALYLPAFLVGGIGLTVLGPSRLRAFPVLVLATITGLANILMGQYFLIAGCAVGLWECP